MASYDQYRQYIERDPWYQQALANAAAGDASALANAQAGAKRLAVMYGGNFGGIPNDWLDPQTLKLAQQNKFSTLAQLQRALEQRKLSDADQLAARGMLRSGELPHALEEANRDNEFARYNAANELAQLLAGIQTGLSQAQAQGQTARTSALDEAYRRAVETYGGTVAQPAPLTDVIRTAAAKPRPPAVKKRTKTKTRRVVGDGWMFGRGLA